MAKVSVEIRPLSAGPYPLVPNEGPYVDHEYFECGDPEWCLHEPAPPDDEEFYKLIPIPNAAEPKVFGMDEEWHVRPDMSKMLRTLGFGEKHASGFAVIFHETIDAIGEMDLHGYFNHNWGYVDQTVGEVGCYYPLAVHVLKGLSKKRTNRVIWHEIGHAVRRHIDKSETELAYGQEDKVSRVKRLGIAATSIGAASFITGSVLSETEVMPNYAGALLGVGGAITALGGLAAMWSPNSILWLLSPEEQYCERFARKHHSMQVLIDN